MNNQIISSLEELGLNKTQSQIFLYLYQYGPQPAASVARHIGGERTNTYKLIETMMRHGYISETIVRSTKQFYIADKNVLRNQLEHQKKHIQKKEQLLPSIEQELAQLDQERISALPAMRFYQGKSDIEIMARDMIAEIEKQELKMIRVFSTNTLESQAEQYHIEDYMNIFLSHLSKKEIACEVYLGNGILFLERMIYYGNDPQLLSKLPAGQSSMTLIIIGNISYILIFKNMPAGIKIESPELSDVLKFFLKLVK